MTIERDRDGMIKIFRPSLDLFFFMVNGNRNVLLDNHAGRESGKLPPLLQATGHGKMVHLSRLHHFSAPAGDWSP
jgi:hypothetical protein